MLARATILVGLLTFTMACSADPHALRITEANKDSFLKDLKDSKGFTVEEVGLLMSFQMRNGMANAIGGRGESPVGRTVGEIIEAERKVRADADAKEAEQKRLAAEAKAKEDALTAELRKAINLTVFDKGFHDSNPQAGDFEDLITVKCAYENNSGKDIRAFKGRVRFTDLFGVEIFSIGLTIDDPISTGQKATWAGTIKYNQFVSEHQKLRNTELANMKVEWRPLSIIYADGTTVGNPQ